MHSRMDSRQSHRQRAKRSGRLAAVIVGACVIIAGVIAFAVTRLPGHLVGSKSPGAAATSVLPAASQVSSPTTGTPTRVRVTPSVGGTHQSPEPSHTPGVNGGTLTSHCTPAPADTMTNTVSHLCGFPDTTNTGVPSGVKLINVPGQESRGKGWTYDNQNGLIVTRAGAVISGLNIENGIEIKASNVIIKDSVITETGDWWGIGLYDSNNVTIEHCDISSPDATGSNRLQVGIKDVYGNAVGTRIIDDNIWHTSTAIQIANGVFEGNYIHDYGYNAAEGDHLNGISVGGGDLSPLLIQDNTILDNYAQTDAIALFQDFGNEGNKTVNDNLLAGGSYTIYGGGPNISNGQCASYTNSSGCYGASNNIVVTNNRFSRMYFSTCGVFGPIAAFNQLGSGNVWQGNVWDNSNKTVPDPKAY